MSPLGKLAPNNPTSLGVTTLVQRATTVWTAAVTTSPSVATLTGVTSGDRLVIAIAMAGTINQPNAASVVTTVGSTTAWAQIAIENPAAASRDAEIWSATATASGTVAVTVTPSVSTRMGLWIGELSNGTLGTPPRAPVAGSSQSATNTSVTYLSNNVAYKNSWVCVLSNVGTGSTETDSVGLGTFDAGATRSGSQASGLTYGTFSLNAAGATGWTIGSSGSFATVSIVVPP